MMTLPSTRALTAMVLLAAVGAASTALAQSTPVTTSEARAAGSVLDFRSSSWLRSRAVFNNNAEEIGSVSDLILDRGSGHIEYVVVKTGTTLGMGGRAVAIPYSSFRWEVGGKDHLLLALTAEQIKLLPEYTAEHWKAPENNADRSKSTIRQQLDADAKASSDPYAGSFDSAKKARITGEVTNVERTRTSSFGEQIVITVTESNGQTRKVALGPSWYVNGMPAAPMRGDKVVVETLALPRDPDQLLAGTELKNGERELHLRDTDGTPAWSLRTSDTAKDTSSTPYSRYLLLSHLSGLKVDCRGVEAGRVHDIILERNSGELAFISIDPNQNFLGIKDTKRLVPWSVATVTLDDVAHIDASKDMVLASPETPSELTELNTRTSAERVYKAFGVPIPRFDSLGAVTSAFPETNSAWAANGTILSAIQRDTRTMFEGRVAELSEMKFEQNSQPARTMTIHLNRADQPDAVILLGPAWYLSNQKDICRTGDTVMVDACRTMIDGKQYWIAKSIQCKDSHVVLLDADNKPAWITP